MATAPNPTKLVMLAARGLAELRDDELRGNQLHLELEVSVWLRRSGADLASVPRMLLALRQTLLDVSALDADSEPVPLVLQDTQRAVASLCAYLYGLVARGAASLDMERGAFVEIALAHLSQPASGARRTS